MKLDLVAVCCVSIETATSNDAHSRSLGFPIAGSAEAHARKLAVVGGGPSILDHVEELRGWDGDIWAINGAWAWCNEHGISSRLISVDPKPGLAELAAGAVDALLATTCDPSVFAAVQGATLIDVHPFGKIGSGPTTATAIPSLAVRLGYGSVTFFGCESSFVGKTHAYDDTPSPYLVRVECGGEEYTTEAEYLMQAETLAAILRAMPAVFQERSGGLLTALVAHQTYSFTAVSPHIHKSLTQAA